MIRRSMTLLVVVSALALSRPAAHASGGAPDTVCLIPDLSAIGAGYAGDLPCVDLVPETVQMNRATGEITAGRAELAALLAVAPNDLIIIGVDYKDSGYRGRELWWTTNHRDGCHPEMKYFYANRMPSGWNDKVSSAIGYTGCDRFVHFENVGRSGAIQICSCSSMGAMNDETSSVYFSG